MLLMTRTADVLSAGGGEGRYDSNYEVIFEELNGVLYTHGLGCFRETQRCNVEWRYKTCFFETGVCLNGSCNIMGFHLRKSIYIQKGDLPDSGTVKTQSGEVCSFGDDNEHVLRAQRPESGSHFLITGYLMEHKFGRPWKEL